jgi:amino acid transporter
MGTSTSEGVPGQGLRKDAIGAPAIVLMVLAFIAPMAASVALTPLGIGFGNGSGFPGTILLAAAALFCFAVGYVEMSRHVVNAGAFYAYISRGLGRPLGVAAAAVAVLSYPAMLLSVTGSFGYFARATFDSQLGISLPWYVWSLILLVAVGALAYFRVELSAKILGVALVLELLIILIVDFAVVAQQGLASFSWSVFSPASITSGAPGVAFVYAFAFFVGFEATAIFGEECRDPKRTVGRATFACIFIIAVFYVFTSWAFVTAYGTMHVQAAAAQDPGNFTFAIAGKYVGSWAVTAMQWLILTSAAASVLAVQNGTARYLMALGRVRLLPSSLAKTQPRTGSPYVAVAVLSVVEIVIILACAFFRVDPYVQLSTVAAGLGTFGVVLLQAGASTSVVGFFLRRPDRSLLKTIILPAIGAVALAAGCVLMYRNFWALTGQSAGLINQLPWLTVAVAVLGVGYALWIRSARPDKYERIASMLEEGDKVDAASEDPMTSGAVEAVADGETI